MGWFSKDKKEEMVTRQNGAVKETIPASWVEKEQYEKKKNELAIKQAEETGRNKAEREQLNSREYQRNKEAEYEHEYRMKAMQNKARETTQRRYGTKLSNPMASFGGLFGMQQPSRAKPSKPISKRKHKRIQTQRKQPPQNNIFGGMGYDPTSIFR